MLKLPIGENEKIIKKFSFVKTKWNSTVEQRKNDGPPYKNDEN